MPAAPESASAHLCRVDAVISNAVFGDAAASLLQAARVEPLLLGLSCARYSYWDGVLRLCEKVLDERSPETQREGDSGSWDEIRASVRAPAAFMFELVRLAALSVCGSMDAACTKSCTYAEDALTSAFFLVARIGHEFRNDTSLERRMPSLAYAGPHEKTSSGQVEVSGNPVDPGNRLVAGIVCEMENARDGADTSILRSLIRSLIRALGVDRCLGVLELVPLRQKSACDGPFLLEIIAEIDRAEASALALEESGDLANIRRCMLSPSDYGSTELQKYPLVFRPWDAHVPSNGVCPLCALPLFEEPSPGQEKDSALVSMKCGHAYHFRCFEFESGCPLCLVDRQPWPWRMPGS